jgi:hypothetical protein
MKKRSIYYGFFRLIIIMHLSDHRFLYIPLDKEKSDDAADDFSSVKL